MLFKAHAERRRRMPKQKQKRKVTDWLAYDASLRQRGGLTIWFGDEAIAAWQLRRGRRERTGSQRSLHSA